MRYRVYLYLALTSEEAEIKCTVPASDCHEAINLAMKALDLSYVPAASASPLDGEYEGPSIFDWRWSLRCSVSEKVSIPVSL
jgi:hypothetical protein